MATVGQFLDIGILIDPEPGNELGRRHGTRIQGHYHNEPRRAWNRIVMVAVLICLFPREALAAVDQIIDIASARGVTQRMVITTPKVVEATVILFSGGSGRIGLWEGRWQWEKHEDFLIRSRRMFVKHGFQTVIVGLPSDRKRDRLTNFRHTGEHRQDIESVIAYVRGTTAAPVWLVGTSRGTVSVAHLAAKLADKSVDGIILTATVTVPGGTAANTIFDADLASIRVPVLLVHHRQDGCAATPAYGAKDALDKFSGSPDVGLVLIKGGGPEIGRPCEPKSAHGFVGVEDDTIARMAFFIKKKRD